MRTLSSFNHSGLDEEPTGDLATKSSPSRLRWVTIRPVGDPARAAARAGSFLSQRSQCNDSCSYKDGLSPLRNPSGGGVELMGFAALNPSYGTSIGIDHRRRASCSDRSRRDSTPIAIFSVGGLAVPILMGIVYNQFYTL